jgi:NADH:ubiquinone oxidoreductase subunit 5 (subunit L)/multisubunit Na+/H+ antiporter MnhA subunit
MNQKMHNLTPIEQANEEKRAYDGFLRRLKIYSPPPEPDARDLVHSNPVISRALTRAVSLIPGLIAVIVVTAIFISADRTFQAFSEAAAHDAMLWAAFIGLLGVVFTEGSLVITEFAAVRARLQSNQPRRVWTLPGALRGIGVRLGLKKPLSYDEMPDTNLERFAAMVFILVLAANVFVAVTPLLEENGTSWAAMTDLAKLQLGFAVFMGVVAPFGLKFVGSYLAKLSYELFAQQQAERRQQMYEDWRADMQALWEVEGPRLVAEAMHAKFCAKNSLPPSTESPYLLTAGMDERGEMQLAAVPFSTSQEPLPTPSGNASPNGSRSNQTPL